MSSTPPPPPPPPSQPPPPGMPSPGSPAPGSGQALGPGGRALPSPWKRIGARFLDGLILGLIGLGVAAAVLSDGDGAGFAGVGTDASFGKLYLIGLIGAGMSFVWDAVCTKMFGGTPMKLAMGMKVVQAGNGEDVEWGHAIIRWAVPGALGLLPLANFGGLINLVVVIVSLVFLFTRPLRQAVWDLAAKTIVVEK